MSEQRRSSYSQQMDAVGRRTASRNQHLCRLLSSEVEKLECQQSAARRQHLQEIHGIRMDLANQEKEKSELKRRGSLADTTLLPNQVSNRRPQSSPVNRSNRSSERHSLMLWAGESPENHKRTYRYKRPQSAQPLRPRTGEEAQRPLSTGLQKQLIESKTLRRQSMTSLSATLRTITPSLAPIPERRNTRNSVQFELGDELIIRRLAVQRRRATIQEVGGTIIAVTESRGSSRRRSDVIS